MRRAIDVVVAGLALIAVAPLMLVVAIALRLAHGRPLMFSQVRCSQGGRLFAIRKFRTMTSARDAAGMLLPDAQRITRFGRMLRATRIDELPQLVSILAGDMSLIGPRPLPPAVLAQAADGGALRCRIKPGLTGWAQVNGNARLTDRDKLALDAWYVGHRSAWLDLVIVARTLRVIVLGESVDEGAIRKAYATVGAHESWRPHACGTDRRG